MNTSTFARVCLTSICLCLTFRSGAAEISLPQQVERALVRNSAQLSPITLEFIESTSSVAPQSETMKTLLMENYDPAFVFFKRTSRMTWQDKCIYLRTVHQDGDVNEYAFDGNVFYLGGFSEDSVKDKITPRLSKTVISELGKDQGAGADTSYLQSYYFSAAGFSLPTKVKSLQSRQDMRSIPIEILQRGGRLESIQAVNVLGRRCTRMILVEPNDEQISAQKLEFIKI